MTSPANNHNHIEMTSSELVSQMITGRVVNVVALLLVCLGPASSCSRLNSWLPAANFSSPPSAVGKNDRLESERRGEAGFLGSSDSVVLVVVEVVVVVVVVVEVEGGA